MSVLQYAYSSGSQNILRLASALAVNYPDPEVLKEKCKLLWPGCEIYCGHTHFRVTLHDQSKETSFYFDSVPDGSCDKYPNHKPNHSEMQEPVAPFKHYPKGRY